MPRKSTKPTTNKTDNTGPDQVALGGLIASALKVHGNSILTSILENSESLELSKEQLHTISGLIEAKTSKVRSDVLQQLVNLY